MKIENRGYIVNNVTEVITGTWATFGGAFIGFPGEDIQLKSALEVLRHRGVPQVETIETNKGFEFELSFVNTSSVPFSEIGNTLAALGYSLVSAEAVERGEIDVFTTNAAIASNAFSAWSGRRGYVLDVSNKPITLWYLIGDVVEIFPIGNHPLDDIVSSLKIEGIPGMARNFTQDGFTGHSETLIPYVEATPIDIAIVLLDRGYTMLSAAEVEAPQKQENWIFTRSS